MRVFVLIAINVTASAGTALLVTTQPNPGQAALALTLIFWLGLTGGVFVIGRR